MHLDTGARLILMETPDGVLLSTRDQLKKLVRRDLAGLDLVGELVAQRRAAAATEDADYTEDTAS